MDSKLICEIGQREEGMTGIEAFLVFSVTAFHLAVVAGRVGADEFVPYAQFRSSGFKESWQIPLAVGKAVGEFKTVVGLYTLDSDAAASVPAG